MPHDRHPVTLLTRCAIVAATLLVAACATRTAAPVEERRPPPAVRAPAQPPVQPPTAAAARPAEPEIAATYTVKRGDTLAGIALEHGLDYRELAAWNGIENPNRILVGQVLRLRPPGEGAFAGAPVAAPATGVVTTPLRSVPPVADARPPAPAVAA